MAKRKRVKLRADELRALQERSKNKCECCGLDITVDKHHVWEFAQGGPDVASNMLCLCPSCHRVLPKLLSEEDQKFLQTLNFEKSSGSFSFYSTESAFEIGHVRYRDFKYIFTLDGKPIIYPYQINGRFYVNIVMLKHFDPYLLVIANKIIYKTESITLMSEPNRIKIVREDTIILEIERLDSMIKVTLNFHYKGEPFIFNDEGSIFPGNFRMSYFTLVGNKIGGAISYNFPNSNGIEGHHGDGAGIHIPEATNNMQQRNPRKDQLKRNQQKESRRRNRGK